jgi:hypothetical protein
MALRPIVTTSRDVSTNRNLVEDSALSKIVKYIPAEMVALYTALRGIIVDTASVGQSIHCGQYRFAFICVLILTPLYTYFATQDSGKKNTAWFHITVSTIAYCVWVYSFGDVFQWCWIIFGQYDSRYGAVALLVFTAVVPVLEKIFIRPVNPPVPLAG